MIVNAETVTVCHADGTAAHLRTALLGRSALLQHTISENNDGDEWSLPLPEGVIHAWL